MGTRRDDISSAQRAQISIEVLGSNREWGRIVELADSYDVSRKTIYDIAGKGKQVLVAGMAPGPLGPQQAQKLIKVDRNRLERGQGFPILIKVGKFLLQ